MPYIKSEDYARALEEPAVPGELNYAMTMAAGLHLRGEISLEEFKGLVEELVDGYMDRLGTSYTNYNNVIGAIHCCGLELLRRVVNQRYTLRSADCQLVMNRVGWNLYHDRTAPYEDEKIAENGDVFPVEMTREAEV